MMDGTIAPRFEFDNSYRQELEGFYVPWNAASAPAPSILMLNSELAAELGLDSAVLQSETGVAVLSGNVVPEGASPLAQAYAGHQFGGFSPQLGDGRALLLGEVIDAKGRRRDIQLKGSGPTPFSRGGDGKAAIGPVLREYVISEAMHALGIPTTRSLAAIATGERVRRDRWLPGAVLTRVAASHIRVGTFQFFAARRDTAKVRRLADYAIARHYPHTKKEGNTYLAFFNAVAEAQAALVAGWMHVGFIHGVMNTDNMAISGETIDYGPCAFMDHYAPDTVFSSIDEHGRYAFANQPAIAQWNLTRFAEALLSIVHSDADEAVRLLTDAVNTFPSIYLRHWLSGMLRKIGLQTQVDGDHELVNRLFFALEGQQVDYTNFFRSLSNAVQGDPALTRELFADPAPFDEWLEAWRERLAREPLSVDARVESMNRVNPAYIARNHKVEAALSAASNDGDLAPLKALIAVLRRPFDEDEDLADYAKSAPAGFGPYRTFCGT